MFTPARITVAAASLIVLSSCATFTDDDIAARVGDVEMTEDQLSRILREELGDDVEVAPMLEANEVLNNFVLDQVLRTDLAAAGSPLPEADVEWSNITLQESVGQSFAAWQTTVPAPISPERIRAKYELGPFESNLTCTAHILVESEATANDLLDQLDDGADFADLAAEFSIDPGSGVNGGILPCDSTNGFSTSYIPEYVEATLDAEVGEAVGPVESQFGFHIILVRPFDDLADGELDPVLAQPPVRFDFAATDIDVYVNPRYGAFDAARGVVPLG